MSRGLVLVVEDNPITRKMLRVTLEIEGYEALDAPDGETALELVAARRPDLLILDYVLPDTDGLRLMAQLREKSALPELPAILITGMVSRVEELGTRSGGFSHVLAKPVEPSRLLEIVGALLAPTQQRKGGKRVLVVDDEALNLKLTSFRLKEVGYVVETASSGEEALEMARRRPPDAILTDVMMPGMDGFTLCLEARRDARVGSVPIVLMSSAYVDEADRDLARQMGANALVVRTPDVRHALDALAASLGGGAQTLSATAQDVTELHRERLQVQLERQTARNEALLRQAAIQATALSIIRGLSEVLAQPRDVTHVLGDVLVHCLDAAGLSTGLLYVTQPGQVYRLQAQFGIPVERHADAEKLFGHPELIRGILESGQPAALSDDSSLADPATRDFLTRVGHSSVLLVPFVVLGQTFGALALASDNHDLSETSWVTFARNLALQFGQTVALGESLKRLAASESRYRALMEHANDAILILDPAAQILEVNREAERLLGRRREDVIGRSYEDFVAPDEQAESTRLQDKLLADKTLRVENRHLVRADGSRVSVDVSASLIALDGESVDLTILRDITQRQEAERALREAELRLQHVVSSSPAVLFSLSPDGGSFVTTWISENVERLLGFTPEDALQPEWWPSHIHPADQERVFAEVAGLHTSSYVEHEYRFRRRGGGYCWLRAVLRLLRDPTGNPVEAVGSWSDVSARKEAEIRLRESEEQYRLLFDHNPHPMWVFHEDTHAFLAVNDATVRAYGYSRDEFLAMTALDIRSAEEVDAFRRVHALFRAEHPHEPYYSKVPSRHLKKNGSVIEVDIAATSIVFQGHPARLVLATDVTEKQALQTQLTQAQKMEAIGQLAGGVAHDFNNLLGVITGYSELLIRELPPDSRQKERGEAIKRASDRAAALTRQLLAFSRRQVLQPKVLDLNEAIGEVARMMQRLISENIHITTTAGPNLGKVRADAGQVEQVVMNLAINARDAMPSGGHLAIETTNVDLDEAFARAHPETRPGPYVMLSVSDTGHGMDAPTMGRIFEPFFTTKGEGKGTGLGLATVYGIVRQSGGTVTVQSEPGHGTTFRVYLPRVDAAVATEQRTEPVEAKHGTETVLLVEDAEALRLLIRELLEEAGYTVLDAAAPDKALALVNATSDPIHVVLTDMVMPQMSGQELARHIAAVKPHARIVFMSGYSDQMLGDEATLGPEVLFLQKPFTMDALMRAIRKAVEGDDPAKER